MNISCAPLVGLGVAHAGAHEQGLGVAGQVAQLGGDADGAVRAALPDFGHHAVVRALPALTDDLGDLRDLPADHAPHAGREPADEAHRAHAVAHHDAHRREALEVHAVDLVAGQAGDAGLDGHGDLLCGASRV